MKYTDVSNNDLKTTARWLISLHIGRSNPITGRELREIIQLDPFHERRLRSAISELRHDGFPILFATQKPAGYYLPDSLSSLHEGLTQLRSYIIDECITLRDLRLKGQQYLASESQLSLFGDARY